MYFFECQMNQRKEQWKKCATGMWYLQDYIMFFQMLQSLDVEKEESLYTHQSDFTTVNNTLYDSQLSEKIAEAMYVFQTKKIAIAGWWDQMVSESATGDFANSKFWHKFFDIEARERPSTNSDTVCHRFSVLPFFFDCRDNGACRHAWEDFLLEYLGNKFSNFSFESEFSSQAQKNYYNQPWFQIQFFLELNFMMIILLLFLQKQNLAFAV